ncbi:hypothetical protein V6R86_08470 [Sphingomonas kaistensis]|uniref:Antitoxin Xre/MbcA/ParS-like toxin-binding domain-containing protein n=1 Tax=Sphingomonas kaistensis TaxID=298708 RepID=A0ABZ2G168_9SPHN
MSSEEELFAKLDRWLETLPAEPTIFQVAETKDADLFAAYVLRHFRAAAKDAVADRLSLEAGKLGSAKWERAGAIGAIVDFLAETWRLSRAEQLTLLGLEDEAELVAVRSQPRAAASHQLLDRLTMLMDIYQALRSLLPGREDDDAWLRRPNIAPLFEGKSAISIMLERGRSGIKDVRAHLWAQIW